MAQLNIGKAPTSPQNPTGSTTNANPEQRGTIRLSVPWTGSVNPVEGRRCKLLVYPTPVTKNARNEDVFGVAVADGDEVTEQAHAHSTTGAMPNVKTGIIERIWPAREAGGVPYVTLVPPESYLTPKAIGEDARFLRSSFDAFTGALLGQDWQAAVARAKEVSERSASIARRIEEMAAQEAGKGF